MNMQFEVPVVRSKDVLVVGGGCAGISAAVCAARHGAKVLLAEANGCLGGMATMGLIGPFMTSYDPAGKRQVIKGFFDEFVRRMVQLGGAIPPEDCRAGEGTCGFRVAGHDHCCTFSPETYKVVAEEMCEEAGVELLYNAHFVHAVLSEAEDRISGAVFSTKAGLIMIEAKVVIDCTGDADVAFESRVPIAYGDDKGTTQPASLFFILDGANKDRMEHARLHEGADMVFQDIVRREIAERRYHIPRDKIGLYECPNGAFRVNMSRVQLKDGCDPFEVTKATIAARKQFPEILDLIHRLVPGCENTYLVTSAPMLGQRETRRIQGDFVLTGDDLRAVKRFDDDVFLAGSSIDMHEATSGTYVPAQGEAYGVPYRVLLPRKVKNLLVAGRSVSMDREALAALRVMPPVFAMGQAAGTAAAICVSDDCDPAKINISSLQSMLKTDGVVLE